MDKIWRKVIVGVMLAAIICGCLARQKRAVIEPIPYGDGKRVLIVPSGTSIGSMRTEKEGLWMDIESWQKIVEKLWRAEKRERGEEELL